MGGRLGAVGRRARRRARDHGTARPDEPHRGRPRALRLALASRRHLLVRHVLAGRRGRPGVAGTVLAELADRARDCDRRVAVGDATHDVRQRRRSAHAGLRRLLRARCAVRSGSPLDASGPVRDPSAPPEPFRDDLRVPVLCFEAETDLMALGYLPARQPDNDKFRLWEVGGHVARRRVHVRGRVHRQRRAADRRARGGLEADDGAARLGARATGQRGTAALRAPGRARRTSIAGCATARRHRARLAWRCATTTPRSSSSTTTATRAAASARRTSTCPSPSSRAWATTAPRSRASAARRSRSAPSKLASLYPSKADYMRQVRRRHRRRRRRGLVPRSRRPRDQGHRRRALPRLTTNRRQQPSRRQAADAGWVGASGRRTRLCRGRP